MPPPPPLSSLRLLRGERWFLIILFLAACGLRCLYAAHFRFDSDEPQHLHVVWGWTQGWLPYRDFFDNHTPVFQALFAPLFAWLGPRADIAVAMRLALFPIFFATIWIVYRLGETLVSTRAGSWAAALTALCPPFFLTSIEFRPDQLWTLLWMATLLVLTGGPFSARRAGWAGLAMGAAFAVSMKSSLMIAALATGGVALLVTERPGWRPTVVALGAFLGGASVVPAIVTLYFVGRGAGHEFYQGVIGHNLTAGSHLISHLPHRLFHWLVCTSLALFLSLGLARLAPERNRRAVFFLPFTALSYYAVLTSFWPIVTLEDYIPCYPAVLAGLLPLGVLHSARLRPAWLLPGAAVALELALLLGLNSPLRNETREKIGIVADTLRLTDPDDFVMDGKGETIYRRRPTFLIMEAMTTRGLKAGRIKDDVEERLIATGTPLLSTHRSPKEDLPFMEANYLPIAFRLMVLGKWLYLPEAGPRAESLDFDVTIPSRYRVVSEGGELAGTLDDQPFAARALLLAAGRHRLTLTGGSGRVALVWAQALERGYSPFAAIQADYRMPRD